MSEKLIYLDNHATTRVDPRVIEAMLPYYSEFFGNAASITHAFGHIAKDAVEKARAEIAASINAEPSEVIFTSGATESANLAIKGTALRPRNKKKHAVTVVTEHKAVLDPFKKVERSGVQLTSLTVRQNRDPKTGQIDLDQLGDAITEETCLVSVMLANNEIGTIQPIKEISQICREKSTFLFTDAAQAIGKIPVDVRELGLDMMGFTAHKFYGPKGIGALFVRGGAPRIRIDSQIDGGGHEHGLRSGTLDVPAIVGFAEAIRISIAEMNADAEKSMRLRNELFDKLSNRITGLTLNGPKLEQITTADSIFENLSRLPANLNCQFELVDGQALAMKMKNLAVSTGSACTSANPEPSHVLRAIGLDDDQARCSIRFGLGRFNTAEEIDVVIETFVEAIEALRKLSSMN